MEATNALDVAEAIATRLCHDMAGLLGTMTGMLDMALEGGRAGQDDAAALAIQAAGQLSAQLRLVRTAWGGGAGALDGDALLALTAGLPGRERFALNMSAVSGTLPQSAARLLLCLLMVAAGAARKGSTIAVSGGGDGFTLDLGGRHPGWPEPMADCLANTSALRDAVLQPRAAGVAIALLVAARMDWVLRLDGARLAAMPVPR